jgi:hypothetical protein
MSNPGKACRVGVNVGGRAVPVEETVRGWVPVAEGWMTRSGVGETLPQEAVKKESMSHKTYRELVIKGIIKEDERSARD